MQRLFQITHTLVTKWPLLVLSGTATTSVLSVFLRPQHARFTVFLMLITMGAQTILVFYNELREPLAPVVEWIDQEAKPSIQYGRALPWLALLPPIYALFPSIGWVLVVLALIIAAPALHRMIWAARYRSKWTNLNLDRIRTYSPQVAVHISGQDGGAYEINQWIPVLEKLQVSTIILARQRDVIAGMDATVLPIIYAKNTEHVEQVLDCGIRTVLYSANSMRNVQLLKHYDLQHFFINHGESDKIVNQSKFLRSYDKLLVGGPLAERRLRRAGLSLRNDQIIHVGRPQAEMALIRRTDKAVRTILYAPTWEGFKDGDDYSSLADQALTLLSELERMPDVHLLFKPHAYTGLRRKELSQRLRQIKALCQRAGYEYFDASAISIHELMNRSDLMICDISSVLTDYLVTEKPIILCVPERISDHELSKNYQSSKATYIHRLNSNSISELVDLIRQEDPAAARRVEVRRDMLGDFPGSALERFRSVVEGSVKQSPYSAITNTDITHDRTEELAT